MKLLAKHTIALLAWVYLLLLTGCGITPIQGEVNMPSNKGVAPTAVDVTTFKGGKGGQGSEMSRLIIGELKREGHVSVSKGANASVMSGQLDIGNLKTDSWSDSYEYKGKTYTVYYYKAEKELSVSYELNVGGEIVGDTFSESYSEQWSGDSSSAAKSKAPNEKSIDSRLMAKIARQIAYDISPHKEPMTFNFHNGDDPHITTAITYVQNRRYDQAMSILRQVVDHTADMKDRAAATYNMGLLFEMQGDFKQAFEMYKDANQMVLGEEDYIKALTRAEERHELNEEFKRQTANRKKK